jgi:hypothetical protein
MPCSGVWRHTSVPPQRTSSEPRNRPWDNQPPLLRQRLVRAASEARCYRVSRVGLNHTQALITFAYHRVRRILLRLRVYDRSDLFYKICRNTAESCSIVRIVDAEVSTPHRATGPVYTTIADASDETATPASAHSASPQRTDAKSSTGSTPPGR